MASLRQLEALINAHNSADIAQTAPGAWSDGRRYLFMADKAIREGNKRQAERFARLGLTQINIARATFEQARYSARAEAAWKRKQDALQARERIVSEIEKLSVEAARQEMVRHLETVLPPNRRREAAQEALVAENRSSGRRTTVGNARRQVGLEMLERARVWLDIIGVHGAAGIDKGLLVGVGDRIASAKEKLTSLDLVGLQQDLETAAVAASRGLDAIRHDHGGELAAAEQAIVERCSAAGVELSAETFGLAAGFSLPGSKKEGGTKALNKWLVTVAETVAELENVHLVVLAASGLAPGTDKGGNRSLSLAKRAKLKLIEAGVPETRLHARGCGGASPLRNLRDGRERIAILFVPVVQIL